MVRKKKLSDNDQKQLLILKSTYEMQVREKEETMLRGKTESIERLNLIINDTLSQMAKIDADFTKKCVSEIEKKKNAKSIVEAITSNEPTGTLFDELEKLDVLEEKYEKINEPEVKSNSIFFEGINDSDVNLYDIADKIDDSFSQKVDMVESEVKADEAIYNNIDPMAQYDIIPLPSKGECYKLKIDRVPVGYLTAADENLITSPNLYESGSISNILLKKKILNKDVDVDNLISGDVDAIMVFLRGTSYGNNFPITATDPRSGKKVDTVVDLSKLNYKPFSLKGDENGYFDFELPRTKAKLKFKFLTKKEEKLLKKLNKKENQGIAAFELSDAVEKVKNALKADTNLSDADKSVIIDANKKLQKWSENLKKGGDTTPYTKAVTNSMEMQIISVNGNSDKRFIHDFVMNMPASDSLAFRRYIYDNQPGVDFEVEVKRPESMGGGSFKCFLEWDDTVFWNIA